VDQRLLEINLFGACVVRPIRQPLSEITGVKHRAMFALLVTAPMGKRTRTFLQDMLWSESCFDSGRQSLRRALSDVKKVLGPLYSDLISTNNSEVSLDLSRVTLIDARGQGEFLEGMDIREDRFNEWLQGIRANPDAIYSLCHQTRQPPARSMVPLITVLPFQLVFGDRRQRATGDWLAEEIGRSLSRSNLLSVISHLSSREFSRQHVVLDDIRKSFNVDYCIAGSIRVHGDKLVLDSDLCDTETGRIMFTRRFEGSFSDFTELNERMTEDVVKSVGRAIADDSVERTRNRRLADIDDHRLLIAAVGHMRQPNFSSFQRARVLFEEAAHRLPTSAEVHAWLGKWFILNVFNGWSNNRAIDTQRALDSTARALDLEPDNSFCITMDGFAHNNLLRRPDIALERYTEALALNPNEALSWLLKGALHSFTDESATAVRHVEKARELSPLDPFKYYYDSLSASAHFADGNYQRGLELAESSYQSNSRHTSTLRIRVALLQRLKRQEEAREAGKELLRHQPDFTVSDYLARHPAAGFTIGHEMADALRSAGLPQ